jgi:hypothetical protein
MQMIPNQAAHKTCGNPAVRQVEIPDHAQDVHTDGILINQIPQLRFQIHFFSPYPFAARAYQRFRAKVAGAQHNDT